MATYTLTDEAAEALKQAVRGAMTAARAQVVAHQSEIGDLYTGRVTITRHRPDYDSLPSGGLSINQPHPTKTSFQTREQRISANLFLSRLRQVMVQITPLGTPSWRPEALVGEAVGLVEDQQLILDALASSSGMEHVVERLALLLPTQPYFGVRIWPAEDKGPIAGSVQRWEAIEADFCGYEPFHRRFSWHSYSIQVGDAPEFVEKYATEHLNRKPWETVIVTEVFHPGFEFGDDVTYTASPAVPTSWFVSGAKELYPRRRKSPDLGELVHTADTDAPVLYIDRALDPAPGEDFAPPEVASWIPIYRSIVKVLDQIIHEVQTTNRVNLYDAEAISDPEIQKILKANPGDEVYVKVDTAKITGENSRGVNATMRPTERNSALSEYIATLNLLLSLYDDVTGVGPLDRGTAVNPEKSATEAAGLFQAAGDRRRDRLRVMARVLVAMGEMYMVRQRKLLGETTTVVLSDTQSVDIRVPNAPMAIRLNASALEAMSRADSLEALMTAHTILVNDAATFQSPSALRMLDESRRRLLKKMGWKDIDQYVDTLPETRDPLTRYIRALHTGEEIVVMESDNHAAYIQTYTDISVQPKANIVLLQDAILRHQSVAKKLQQNVQQGDPQAPVPGVGATGQVDNNAAAELAAGQLPVPTPATVNG